MVQASVRLLLLAVVVLVPVRGLEAAGWVAGLERVTLLALGGLALGALASRAAPGGWGSVRALGAMLGLVPTLLAYAPLAWDGPWLEGAAALGLHLWRWGAAATSGSATSDALVLGTALGLLGWVLGYVAATSILSAHQAWWAIVPGALVLLANLWLGSPGLVPYLLVYLAAALALVGQTQLARWQAQWQRAGLPVEPATAGRATVAALVLSVALVGIAWALPATAPTRQIEQWWSRFSGPFPTRWQQGQASLDRFVTSATRSEQVAGPVEFATSLEPHPSVELGRRVVFEIASPRRGYWRATTYDRYTGTAMASTDIQGQDLAGETPWGGEAEASPERRTVEQRVRVLAAQTSAALAMEAPRQLSLPARWEYRAQRQDVHAIALASPLRRGQSYTVVSSVPDPSVEQLRAASTAYPSWTSRYLQLPDQLPPRVRQEAARVAAGAENSFDRGLKIEAYLRGMTYSTHVPVPPPGRDWVEYLLFDSRQGYCDFFATAMVVLLRTQGIPARVASGFASGQYDLLRGLYVVREEDAHSWVEAYLSPYGWIAFEPSAIRAIPERRSDPATAAAQSRPPTPQPPPEDLEQRTTPRPDEPGRASSPDSAQRRWAWLGALLGPLAGVALALALLGSGLALLWQRGLAQLAWYQRPYAELRRLVDWLGPPAPPALTPLEFGAWIGGHLPALRPQLELVTRTYTSARYRGRPDPSERAELSQAWGTARPLVVRELLRRRWHALVRGRSPQRHGDTEMI